MQKSTCKDTIEPLCVFERSNYYGVDELRPLAMLYATTAMKGSWIIKLSILIVGVGFQHPCLMYI